MVQTASFFGEEVVARVPGWARASRGRHRRICWGLHRWLSSQGALPFVAVRGYRTWDGAWRFLSPVADVLALWEGRLWAYKVQLLAGRPAEGWVSLSPDGEILRSPAVPEVDPLVFAGLGEALFSLGYASRSYLVLPAPGITERVLSLLEGLPVGLLRLERDGSFTVLQEARLLPHMTAEQVDLLAAAQRGDLWYSHPK